MGGRGYLCQLREPVGQGPDLTISSCSVLNFLVAWAQWMRWRARGLRPSCRRPKQVCRNTFHHSCGVNSLSCTIFSFCTSVPPPSPSSAVCTPRCFHCFRDKCINAGRGEGRGGEEGKGEKEKRRGGEGKEGKNREGKNREGKGRGGEGRREKERKGGKGKGRERGEGKRRERRGVYVVRNTNMPWPCSHALTHNGTGMGMKLLKGECTSYNSYMHPIANTCKPSQT